jgi:aryl-alcohol dehydrogenase-like predicted oxidoreductase
MEYTKLGRTSLTVSRLCLGTMNFGAATDEPDSFAIMDRALELGFNFFDTANVYGKPHGYGLTEELIGRWLAQGDGRRDAIILATKCCAQMGTRPHDQGLSAVHIRRACDGSLRRLQTDHIDLYQMHHVDRGMPTPIEQQLTSLPYVEHLRRIDHGAGWDEIWQAMDQLVASGKVCYVGTSNFPAWEIARGNTLALARNSMGLVSEQSRYNLSVRANELEVNPACEELGLGVIPWSPLAGGLLAGALQKAKEGRRAAIAPGDVQKYGPQLTAYEDLCREIAQEPADVALAWLLANPVVTAPIIGPRTMEQLTGSLRALEIELSGEVMSRLDAIWPGPGGKAPEAYAW